MTRQTIQHVKFVIILAEHANCNEFNLFNKIEHLSIESDEHSISIFEISLLLTFVNKFIKFWEGKNVKVFIIEQSDDNRKFNRGQLLNLGFLLAEKENFDNYIFHDVDLIPSEELLPYYFYNLESPISLIGGQF